MMKLIRHSLVAVALLGTQALLLTAPAAAAGDPCKLEISGDDQMQYDKKELAVPATCKEVTETLHHAGRLPAAAFLHTSVQVISPDLPSPAFAGLGAGVAINFFSARHLRVLAS